MASDLQALSGYKVGEISQALFTNQKSKAHLKKNVELSALFSSTNPSQPAFVAVPLKVSRKKEKETVERLEDKNSQAGTKQIGVNRSKRKRKIPTSDDEDEELIKKARKRKKKSSEAEENPERLARTVFVGNLPIEFTRKKLKKLFAVYGEVESVRFRSAALAKPDLSRKVAMKKREFHSDRHNINGYVVFKERECAVKSLKSNGMEVDGLHIRVDLTGQNNKHDHRRSIFVGNLPFDTEEEPLRQVFNDCGEIEAVRIVRDSKTGLGKGFGFILFEEKDAVMFALKKNQTEFRGRALRVYPSTENPQQGHSNDVKSRSKTYSFSGITAKRGIKKEHKGKKKQKFVRGYKGSQSAQNSYGGGKKPKHRNEKLNNPKNRNRTSKFSKNSSKQGRNNMKGKPSR
ncbi:RNA-binding protein 34-like [Porites lutea]|uniref:RNA-binding protein 34-like n=1 Tax=Porites lutea TaxID=51062 RepID=UPI003CC683F8